MSLSGNVLEVYIKVMEHFFLTAAADPVPSPSHASP